MQGMTERLEAMLAKGTDNMLLRFSLGKAYAEQDCYGDAERHLRVALEFDPDYSVAWKWLGKACLGQGDKAGARGLGVRPGSSAGARRPAGGEGTAGLHEAAGQASLDRAAERVVERRARARQLPRLVEIA